MGDGMTYSYREQLSILGQISMQEGQSRTLDCPFCGGSKKFTISRTDTGVLLWNCYKASCPAKGSHQGKQSASSLRAALNAPKALPSAPVRRVTPLPAITKNIRNDASALTFVTDNNCLDAYDNGYVNIRYAPAEKRVLFYNAASTGAVGRSLAGHRSKWWSYGDVSEGIHVGVGTTAVLVEDTPSACAVSRLQSVVGVALLGTNITEQLRNTLKVYDTIYIVLDNDASVKAPSLARSLSNAAKVRLTKNDLKHLSVEDIERVLYS